METLVKKKKIATSNRTPMHIHIYMYIYRVGFFGRGEWAVLSPAYVMHHPPPLQSTTL